MRGRSFLEGLMPHERQTTGSQVLRPIILGGLLLVLAVVAALVLSITAVLIGRWFGPAVLVVTALVCLRWETAAGEASALGTLVWRARALTENDTPRAEALIAFLIGVVYTGLGLFVTWPLVLQVDSAHNYLWIAFGNSSRAVSLAWFWWLLPPLIAVDLAFPFAWQAIWRRFLLEIQWPNFADSVTALRGRARPGVNPPIEYNDADAPIDPTPRESGHVAVDVR